MNETTAEFICACLGISPSICHLLDEIEKNFRIDEYYALEEDYIIELVRNSLLPENRHRVYMANMLILNYYMEIANHTIEAYCDYPEMKEELFEMIVDGYYSDIKFNGEVVKNQEQLDQAVQDWILKTQKQ